MRDSLQTSNLCRGETVVIRNTIIVKNIAPKVLCRVLLIFEDKLWPATCTLLGWERTVALFENETVHIITYDAILSFYL